MQTLMPVRGTQDLWQETYRQHRWLVGTIEATTSRYGYHPIETPIFESSSLFTRSLGATSDVVMKEMYQWTDQGGNGLTLRPEGTASVVRAFSARPQALPFPAKFFYSGSMFRYERPQKGRLRQFHQAGVEALGSMSPFLDAEVIACGMAALRAVGVVSGMTLHINSLGNRASRQRWRDALFKYFSRYEKDLSPMSRARLQRNPLRILDSKEKEDQEIKRDAPPATASMDGESRQFFEQVCESLTNLQISFVVDKDLVRGLDYYVHTAFEARVEGLGSQNAVLAGGRYDGLLTELGGKPADSDKDAGVGWACGIERLALLADAPENNKRPIAVIPIAESDEEAAFALAQMLRQQGFEVDYAFSGKMRKRLQRADKLKAIIACLIGEEEQRDDNVTVRMLDDGKQSRVARSQLASHLRTVQRGV